MSILALGNAWQWLAAAFVIPIKYSHVEEWLRSLPPAPSQRPLPARLEPLNVLKSIADCCLTTVLLDSVCVVNTV